MARARLIQSPLSDTSLGKRIAKQFEVNMRLPLGNKTELFQYPQVEVNNTLKPTTWDNANVEAERGEVAVTNFMKDGIPEHYVIGGNRHYDGGTPLNLPNNSFIFSRDRKLKIKDPDILSMFGKPAGGKQSYVPADLAKQYKINEYRRILADPNSSKLEISTAERMITNYNNKLGALSLVQESLKGFPEGLPAIAMGYMGNIGLDPSQILQMPGMNPESMPAMKYGGQYQYMKKGGTVRKQQGGSLLPKGQQARYNAQSGQYEIVDRQGRVIGIIEGSGSNAPAGGGTQQVGKTSTKSTKTQNVPDNAVRWDETAPGYDATQMQPGDYVKKADGSWYQVTGYTTKNYGYNDPRLGELQPAYGHLQQTITGNPDLQQAIYENYQKHIQQGQLSQEEKDRLLNVPKDEVINKFLEGQKQVYAINANGLLYEKNEDGSIKRDAAGNPVMKSERELKQWETRDSQTYRNSIRDIGFTDQEIFSGEDTAIFQAAYRGLEDASQDERFADTLSNFNITPVGLKDSHGLHTYDNKPISPVDKYFGNTTAGQAVLPKELDQDLTTEEVEWAEDPKAPLEAPTLDVEPEMAPDAPWWLQDIIKTSGAAGDMMKIKKHSPWQATPGVYTPNPTFFDPTRALASNAELANIGVMGSGVFAGPQAFGARQSRIQGQAAQNAANILGQYENQNVNVANQFELNKSQILNQASLNKANLATQLYDKNVIANQQFDNSKAQARQMLRQSYIDAITNRAQTQTLNQLYPQYSVDPSTGGFMQFTKGRDIKPTMSNNNGLMNTFQEYKNMNPGVSDEVLYKMAAADMGMPDNTPVGVDPAYFANYGNMMPR